MALYSPRRWVFNSIKPLPQPGLFIHVMLQPLCPCAPGRVRWMRGWRDGHGGWKEGDESLESERFIESSRCTKSGDGGTGSTGNAMSPRPPPSTRSILGTGAEGEAPPMGLAEGGSHQQPPGADFGASRLPGKGKHPGCRWGWGQTSKERGHVGDHSKGHRETRGSQTPAGSTNWLVFNQKKKKLNKRKTHEVRKLLAASSAAKRSPFNDREGQERTWGHRGGSASAQSRFTSSPSSCSQTCPGSSAAPGRC